ncbi:MAG: flagellar filament capping protein FliD [Pirellulales bacterium]|nr:flagellar filament capping protein FliD [Pirellulales bacterium]
MGRITSSVGLITGLDIDGTVKQLMAVAARPRDLLKSRNEALKQEQTALDTLGSRLLAFQFAVNKLKSTSVFTSRQVASSNKDLLQASLPASGTPAVGAFQVRPVQVASAQQLISQAFDSSTASLGSGTFSFRYGGFLDKGASLDQLNGGAGVPRGKIRITDRNGDSAVVDLTFARTVDDVLAAINTTADVAVTASTSGDAFVLTDSSGGAGNLVVQEVAGGTTAAGLGLAGISVAAAQATGGDVYRLAGATKLTALNDGLGVHTTREGVTDLDITLSDGTALAIDLHDLTTLDDVLAQINAADPARLSAAISADGNRLALTDLSGGAGSFAVANGAASRAATDLGIENTAAGATLSGERLIAGLRDTLLASLNGGQGLGALGQISITDRSGGVATIDLAAAETLGDVIELINGSAADVAAAVNQARNGLTIIDQSGGSGNLIIADADAAETAAKLGIAINQAAAAVNSGALKRQTIGEATLLSSLNGGKGVSVGDIQIVDSAGVRKAADLNPLGAEVQTVGDVIDAINALDNGVEARINDAGDGILLVDTAGGTGALGVKDLSGNIAQSLNLTRTSKTIDLEGAPTQVVDGTTSYSIDLDDLDVSSDAVTLASLKGGAGIARGDVLITDSTGQRSLALDLNGADAGITTIGQLIDAINAKAASGGVGVAARLNDAGNGIYLEDTAGGPKKLTVADRNSTAAADLKIAGEAKLVGGKQVINGAGAFSSTSALQTGLGALAAQINNLGAGVTASTVFDGAGYRLSLAVNATGAANELLIDAQDSGLVFHEVAQARDAALLYGNGGATGGGILVSSPDNTFEGAVGGVDLTVAGASETPLTVTVQQTDADLVKAVQDVVDAYNALRSDLGKLTSFDAETATTGLLFGTSEALQIDSRLSRALTDRYAGLGSLESLTEIGLSVDADGKLELNKSKLQSAFAKNPEEVQKFLATPTTGVVAKISAAVDRLAGAENSMLSSSSDSLQDSIAANEDRLERFSSQLEKQQERLLAQFYQLESIIAKLQQSQTTLAALQPVAPLGS